MKHLLSYKLFEFKLRDRLYQNIDFDDSQKLVDKIKIDYQDIEIKIKYYDNVIHDIKRKLEKRSDLISIEEFNLILEKTINQIFPDKLKEFTTNGKYELKLKDNKFSIIIYFNENKFYTEEPEILVVTLMIGDVNKCIKIIEINDETFLFE